MTLFTTKALACRGVLGATGKRYLSRRGPLSTYQSKPWSPNFTKKRTGFSPVFHENHRAWSSLTLLGPQDGDNKDGLVLNPPVSGATLKSNLAHSQRSKNLQQLDGVPRSTLASAAAATTIDSDYAEATENVKTLQLSLALPSSVADHLIEENALRIGVNGAEYNIILMPAGTTEEQKAAKMKDLDNLIELVKPMEQEKREIDQISKRHANRLIATTTGLIFAQTAVTAKLTFFSRFGWDVMEPITYFITVSVGLAGLLWFHAHRMEFSYPAIMHYLKERKAKKLYVKRNFDIQRYDELRRALVKKREEIARISLDGGLGARLHVNYSPAEIAHRIGTLENSLKTASMDARPEIMLQISHLRAQLSKAMARGQVHFGNQDLKTQIELAMCDSDSDSDTPNETSAESSRNDSDPLYAFGDWRLAKDPVDGNLYYYNKRTHEVSVDPPRT